MLYDVRTYTCRPGTVKKHLALYAEYGLQAQQSHLGKPLFYAMTETGDVNSFVHIWAYESAADRETRRRGLAADPAWALYQQKSGEAGYLISQQNRLMIPADFFKG